MRGKKISANKGEKKSVSVDYGSSGYVMSAVDCKTTQTEKRLIKKYTVLKPILLMLMRIKQMSTCLSQNEKNKTKQTECQYFWAEKPQSLQRNGAEPSGTKHVRRNIITPKGAREQICNICHFHLQLQICMQNLLYINCTGICNHWLRLIRNHREHLLLGTSREVSLSGL